MQESHFFRIRRIPALVLVWMGLGQNTAALSVQSLYPVNGTTGQCLDTPLRMVLSGKAVLNWNGSVRIRNLATNAVVHTWTVTSNPGDPQTTAVSTTWPWQDSVGFTKRNVWPVVLDSIPEYLAEIRVPQHLLAPSTKYQIEVDAGVLKGSDGSAFAGVAAGAWTFTTGAKPSSKSTVVVAQDNSGDVCSVQGGLDLVPSSSKTPVQVLVRPGYYREMLGAQNKNNLRLYGAGTGKTILRYFNSNNLNPGASVRNLAYLTGNGMQLRALSLVSTVPVAGGQAEALYYQGDTNAVSDVFLHSYQDTWLSYGGRSFAQNTTIEGSVDFIWGYNPTFFRQCTLVVNRTGGVFVNPRNAATSHGYVFDSCTVRAFATGYSGDVFARDGGAGGEAMFLHSRIVSGSFLASSPWTISSSTDPATLRFCEYQSKDQNGTSISITDATRKSMQCAADSATAHVKSSFVLGWTPTFASLSSVLALTNPATSVGAREVGGPAAQGRVFRTESGWRIRVSGDGAARVREIRADGRTRLLFDCGGPCEEPYRPIAEGLAWIEIVKPTGRSIVPILGASR
jgi:hypothetical protein